MSHHLCISVTLLDGLFHGRNVETGEAEWPPSPYRFFQAMLAGAATGEACPPDLLNVLRELEGLEPPAIIAPGAERGSSYTLYVPNNLDDLLGKSWANGNDLSESPPFSRAEKVSTPHHLRDERTIHYIYDLTGRPRAERNGLISGTAAVASRLHTLGRGIDAACAVARVLDDQAVAKLPGQRYSARPPESFAGVLLRVPCVGLADDLIQCHTHFLDMIDGRRKANRREPTRFARRVYVDAESVQPRSFAAFDMVAVDPRDRRPRVSFRQQGTVAVAAMLRHTAWNAARADLGDWRTEQWAEQFVAGHGPHEAAESFSRLSYLPIPTLDHADGMIRRAIIAETSGGDGRSARWAARRLSGLPLMCGDTKAEVAILRQVVPSKDRVFDLFLVESDRWQSITPVILPGFDDNSRAKALKLLTKCFEQAGIPLDLIADCEMQRSPWSRASAPTRSYQRSKRLEHLPAWHVRVYFKRRISGPLAVGAGRHRGLGLMAGMA